MAWSSRTVTARLRARNATAAFASKIAITDDEGLPGDGVTVAEESAGRAVSIFRGPDDAARAFFDRSRGRTAAHARADPAWTYRVYADASRLELARENARVRVDQCLRHAVGRRRPALALVCSVCDRRHELVCERDDVLARGRIHHAFSKRAREDRDLSHPARDVHDVGAKLR